MEQYDITGMSCAACSARVEKAVNSVPGVTSCAVSLLTNSMGVEGSASPDEIIKAVKNAGYGASVRGAADSSAAKSSGSLEDTETPRLKKRLIWSLGFLLVLMYFSMGRMMWGWPVPGFFQDNHVAMGLLQLLLAAIVMVINQRFFISGTKSLLHRAPNMDTLVAMGSAASFIWSVINLFAMTKAQTDGDHEAVMRYMHDFWFESAAMILTLITVGKMLEARSKGRTTDALKGLMKLAPETAVVERDGAEVTIPAEQVMTGDIFVVRPGENIPVDGIVIEGTSAVNEASLTGESIPADKSTGDAVSSGTLNQSGFIRCQATRVGQDTTLSRIIKMVSDASATKAPIAKTADKVAGIFVPAVIGIALVTGIIWLIAGKELSYALARAISVLVISCPCALGLATPVAIMVGSGIGARNGILFKTAVSLEETGKIQIIALDKTGTITSGEPVVTDIIPAEGKTETELLTAAYSLEKMSSHPLAGAITKMGEEKSLKPEAVEDFRNLAGNGLSAALGGKELLGGSVRFIGEQLSLPEAVTAGAEALAGQGKTPMLFTLGGELLGMIAVADVIKEDSPQAVAELKNMGIKVVMLTGDNERTARAVGKQAGVDEVIAGVLPDGKESIIRRLKKSGKVAMVGDGINDAPALTRADMGIAIGAGTDVAIDAADIVLMKSRLTDVSAALRLSRAAIRNIRQNLFWAFIYNIIGIPLAAGAFVHLFGWTLNPMYGAAAMSLSSFFVVTNALRLNLIDIHSTKHDKPLKNAVVQLADEQSSSSESATLKIKGMMCAHCEARVKSALEALPFVEEAVTSHEAGTAIVTLSGELDEKAVRSAVSEAGYKYLGKK